MSVIYKINREWLDARSNTHPYRAEGPTSISDRSVTWTHASAVLSEGIRTFAFTTEADRDAFVAAFPDATRVVT